MRALVLCSGTGSVDRAFERRGWEVTSVDWSDRFEPSLCVDITQWDYRAAFPQDYFQFVWASPDCTMFSIARTRGGPRDLVGATALVERCLEIARYFGCEWCLENPATGLLKRQPAMEGLLFIDTCYCKYGFDYKKATRLWHSRVFGEHFRPQPVCCKASPCPALAAAGLHPTRASYTQRHASHAQRGGARAGRGYTQAQLYSMPPSLCDEVARAAEACRENAGTDPQTPT